MGRTRDKRRTTMTKEKRGACCLSVCVVVRRRGRSLYNRERAARLLFFLSSSFPTLSRSELPSFQYCVYYSWRRAVPSAAGSAYLLCVLCVCVSSYYYTQLFCHRSCVSDVDSSPFYILHSILLYTFICIYTITHTDREY